jgi:hypothetical protein
VESPQHCRQRCRQALGIVGLQIVVMGALAGSLAMFAASLWRVFSRHGAWSGSWYPRLAVTLTAAFALFTLRRLWNRVDEWRALRAELAQAEAKLRGQLPGA